MEKLNKDSLSQLKSRLDNNETNYIKVGMSTCGIAAGADEVYSTLLNEVQNRNLDIKVKKTGCLGMCYAEPTIEVKFGDKEKVFYGGIDKNAALEVLNDNLESIVSDKDVLIINSKQKRIVLRNCGVIDPDNIQEYFAHNGYQALAKAIFDLGADGVIGELKKSGLRGRGGAGFPTWMKWNFTKDVASDEKYIICNADEGDPGAYMDRSVLEGDPHAVIEGMIIAGFATGASKGFFYIRAEYPLAIERIQNALNKCHEFGMLGKNILGSNFQL